MKKRFKLSYLLLNKFGKDVSLVLQVKAQQCLIGSYPCGKQQIDSTTE
jgi:hypothetical protein